MSIGNIFMRASASMEKLWNTTTKKLQSLQVVAMHQV